MQFEPEITIFDTTDLSPQHPISPDGYLFTYYPSESPANLHYHDFLEIGYCEKGTGIFNIDGTLVTFSGKCSSIIYAGQTHIAKSINPDKSLWHFLYIDLNSLFSDTNFFDSKFLKSLKSDSYACYSFPSVLSYKEYPEIYELCKQIMSEAANKKEDYLLSIQGLTFSLLHRHERLFSPLDKSEAISDEIGRERLLLMRELGDTLNYLNENYTENITVEQLVRVSNMSKSNLQRKMIAYTGLSPIKYVHHLRLKHATAALLDKRKSISQIATEVGYDTVSGFNRQFLSEYSVSPSAWRKTHL